VSFLLGVPRFLHSTKMFRHGFEQSCSAMVTKKLEEQIQQQNQDAKCGNLAKVAAGAHQRHKTPPLMVCAADRGVDMYFGVRDPPFFDPTVPPHHGPLTVRLADLRLLCPPHLVCSCQLGEVIPPALFGGCILLREQNRSPKYLGNKSEISHMISSFQHTPSIISAFNTKGGNPTLQAHWFSMNIQNSKGQNNGKKESQTPGCAAPR